MKAARLHAFDAALELDESQRPNHRAVRRPRARRRRRVLPHRPAYPAGMVQRHHPVELPAILGHENAGWVEAVGPQVANLGVGDAVVLHPRMSCGMCRACRMGRDMHCAEFIFSGATSPGGFAEYLKTSARAVVKLPPGVQPKDVAAHADAGVTAYRAARAAPRRAPRRWPSARWATLGSSACGPSAPRPSWSTGPQRRWSWPGVWRRAHGGRRRRPGGGGGS